MTIERQELMSYLDGLLQPDQFNDYAPNGLQVEGVEKIQRVVTGVTASQALIDQAIARGADVLLVHHGYFWRNEGSPLVGIKKHRIKSLMVHDINLMAYHLPLDCHPELGNNAQLGKLMGWVPDAHMQSSGVTGLGLYATLPAGCTGIEVQRHLSRVLGREALHIDIPSKPIKRIGWCTGGAQGMIEQAVALGLDAYVSGEISEATVHVARENGVHYFAAGHHATERYGAMALAAHLQQELGLDCEFVDVPNPA
ncbi:Nif3-like dinuclear metal center hexameric protein [Candidatus Njordibacter sp. Uisw_039]|uniref:Nif3-like dinuclear metal center hexameric protein n=1 Tax=Candidatus Njordibacter sp. Uisw_039 TaxID=3230972 RepID=UPI003D5A6DD7